MSGQISLSEQDSSEESANSSTSTGRQLVLASQSPRRRRLLKWLGLPFTVTAVDTDESLNTPLAADPPALAISLAAEKAAAARSDLGAVLGADALLLCFDTVVVLGGEVLGKPTDADDARRMLRELSGRTHQVVTGVALLGPGESQPQTFATATNVTMRQLSDADIEAWMAQGAFMGCAGAYNIEAQVAEVTDDECYQNVAGLPLCHLYARLVGDAAVHAMLPGEPAVPVAQCDAALGRRCTLGPKVVGGV